MVKKTKQWQTPKHRCGPISKTARLQSRDLWLANPPIVAFSANFINPTTVPRGALCIVPQALSTTRLNEEPATKDPTSCLAEFLIAVIESTQGQRAPSLLNLQILCTRSSLLCQTSQDWTRLQSVRRDWNPSSWTPIPTYLTLKPSKKIFVIQILQLFFRLTFQLFLVKYDGFVLT